MSNTLGDFVVATACGNERERTMSAQHAQRSHREMCERIGPVIEAVRLEQKKGCRDIMHTLVF